MEEKNANEEVTQEVTNNAEVGTQANENKDEGIKTFTQEEVNSMLKKEKEKAAKKYEGIDLQKYKEWEESQKSAEQKQAEKEAEYTKAINELNELKQTNAILSAGVKSEDSDYVLFKVSKMEGDFEENLSKFLKDNPKFLKQETELKATGTPVKTVSSNEEDGVLAILKQRHPEMNF